MFPFSRYCNLDIPRCSATCTHVGIPDFEFVVHMVLQPIVSCTKSENRNLGKPRQLVECIAFLVGWVILFPFGAQVTFDVRLGHFIGKPCVFLLKCSPPFWRACPPSRCLGCCSGPAPIESQPSGSFGLGLPVGLLGHPGLLGDDFRAVTTDRASVKITTFSLASDMCSLRAFD